MISKLIHFFRMGHYAWYIWSAYSSVFIFLLMQWFIPWRRWRKYQRKHSHSIVNIPQENE